MKFIFRNEAATEVEEVMTSFSKSDDIDSDSSFNLSDWTEMDASLKEVEVERSATDSDAADAENSKNRIQVSRHR